MTRVKADGFIATTPSFCLSKPIVFCLTIFSDHHHHIAMHMRAGKQKRHFSDSREGKKTKKKNIAAGCHFSPTQYKFSSYVIGNTLEKKKKKTTPKLIEIIFSVSYSHCKFRSFFFFLFLLVTPLREHNPSTENSLAIRYRTEPLVFFFFWVHSDALDNDRFFLDKYRCMICMARRQKNVCSI